MMIRGRLFLAVLFLAMVVDVCLYFFFPHLSVGVRNLLVTPAFVLGGWFCYLTGWRNAIGKPVKFENLRSGTYVANSEPKTIEVSDIDETRIVIGAPRELQETILQSIDPIGFTKSVSVKVDIT
jgi:hypothetical protein